MYVVREGRRRGKGAYLTTSMLYDGQFFYHYATSQNRAARFESKKEARVAAFSVFHVMDYRVVKLKERSD